MSAKQIDRLALLECRLQEGELDPLGCFLMPVLLRHVGRTTRRLEGLHGELQHAPDRHDPSAAVREAAGAVDALGWQLATLASAAGMDLVLERRQERGLDQLLALLAEGLAEIGVVLRPAVSRARLAAHAPGGWQLPWGICTLLLCALPGAERDESARLEWSLELGGNEALLLLPRGPWVERLWRDSVGSKLPGCRLEPVGRRLELRLPGDWLLV